MAYLALNACHGLFQAIDVGVYSIFTPRNTLADKSTPSMAYLAVNTCHGLFRASNMISHGLPH
eukprot:6176220-Pleurochrysis_carterae.AAC.1